MPEPQTLAQTVRAKFPGAYDDISDTDLEAKVKAKFPGAYDDLPATKAAGAEPAEPAAPPPTAEQEAIEGFKRTGPTPSNLWKMATSGPEDMGRMVEESWNKGKEALGHFARAAGPGFGLLGMKPDPQGRLAALEKGVTSTVGAIPGVGPQILAADESWIDGHKARAMGELAGIGTGYVAGRLMPTPAAVREGVGRARASVGRGLEAAAESPIVKSASRVVGTGAGAGLGHTIGLGHIGGAIAGGAAGEAGPAMLRGVARFIKGAGPGAVAGEGLPAVRTGTRFETGELQPAGNIGSVATGTGGGLTVERPAPPPVPRTGTGFETGELQPAGNLGSAPTGTGGGLTAERPAAPPRPVLRTNTGAPPAELQPIGNVEGGSTGTGGFSMNRPSPANPEPVVSEAAPVSPNTTAEPASTPAASPIEEQLRASLMEREGAKAPAPEAPAPVAETMAPAVETPAPVAETPKPAPPVDPNAFQPGERVQWTAYEGGKEVPMTGVLVDQMKSKVWNVKVDGSGKLGRVSKPQKFTAPPDAPAATPDEPPVTPLSGGDEPTFSAQDVEAEAARRSAAAKPKTATDAIHEAITGSGDVSESPASQIPEGATQAEAAKLRELLLEQERLKAAAAKGEQPAAPSGTPHSRYGGDYNEPAAPVLNAEKLKQQLRTGAQHESIRQMVREFRAEMGLDKAAKQLGVTRDLLDEIDPRELGDFPDMPADRKRSIYKTLTEMTTDAELERYYAKGNDLVKTYIRNVLPKWTPK